MTSNDALSPERIKQANEFMRKNYPRWIVPSIQQVNDYPIEVMETLHDALDQCTDKHDTAGNDKVERALYLMDAAIENCRINEKYCVEMSQNTAQIIRAALSTRSVETNTLLKEAQDNANWLIEGLRAVIHKKTIRDLDERYAAWEKTEYKIIKFSAAIEPKEQT